jgi:hypothetical protein
MTYVNGHVSKSARILIKNAKVGGVSDQKGEKDAKFRLAHLNISGVERPWR